MKKTLVMMGLLFLVPPILSSAMFLYRSYFADPKEGINYGTLIQPTVTYSIVPEVSEAAVEGKWTLLLAVDECLEPCLEKVKQARTIRQLFNEEMNRIQVLYMSKVPLDDTVIESQQPAIYLDYDQSVVSELHQALQSQDVQDTGGIYLFDPLSNLVLYYDEDKKDGKKIIVDMKRLLKYSRIG